MFVVRIWSFSFWKIYQENDFALSCSPHLWFAAVSVQRWGWWPRYRWTLVARDCCSPSPGWGRWAVSVPEGRSGWGLGGRQLTVNNYTAILKHKINTFFKCDLPDGVTIISISIYIYNCCNIWVIDLGYLPWLKGQTYLKPIAPIHTIPLNYHWNMLDI